MSVSSLPEWKQLLLERKRREEEEREKREKQEEEKFASMPAWKRGIIQRRKAKQDSLGDREKERDVCLLQVDVRPPSDGLSDTDSLLTVNLGSELSLSPDPGQWLDAEARSLSQVSLETIVPVHENPFIRTQSSWRKGRDVEIGSEPEVKEKEKEKLSPRSQEGESGRGRDIELKIERFRDLSEGREKERSRDRSQGRDSSRERWEKDKSQWKELHKDAVREREFLKVRKEGEEKDTDPQSSSFSPHVSCLRTIRADNIIIIEQDRKGSDERRGRWRETERERPEEDQERGKRGMKMDLREILAGGGSVTEIRASEVLIIKPSASPEERNPSGGAGGKSSGREDGETKDGRRESMGRELRTDMSWLREKEKERPWGQATVIKEDRKDSMDDNVFVDRGVRVSQLLSKFGEHPKPPSRSKSSDNFLRPGRRKFSGDEDDQTAETDGRNALLKGVPKRSFSFSDRAISAEENGLDEDGCYDRKTRERIHSDKSVATWVDVPVLEKETATKIKMGCARLLDKDRFGRHREKPLQRRTEAEMSIHHRSEVKKAEHIDSRAVEKVDDADGDEGFTVASVKNTEGISFARRVPIRLDGKARAEREGKRLADEKSLEIELSAEKDSEVAVQIEREEGFESTIPESRNYVVAAELPSPCHPAESQYRHESAFTECSSLLCPVPDRARDLHRGPEWSGTGPQGPYLTHNVLSQQTEDLLSKIEKIGDTAISNSDKGERAFKAANEGSKESKQEAQAYSESGSESLLHEVAPRSPKRIAPMGISPGPLEIQIPRTVFYVADETVVKKKAAGGQSNEGQDWEEGKGVERRDSWRIGKPLSRIESLREKIRQRELERLKQGEAQDGGGSECAEMNVTQTAEDGHDEEGNDIEKEWEAAAHMRKRLVEAERGQEDAAGETSMTALDVTQEVSVLKTSPQLPVSVPQAVSEEEVTSGYATAASEVVSDSLQVSEDEDDPVKHVEEQLRRHRDQHENRGEEEEEEEEEEKELSEQELQEYTSPLNPVQSLSPLPLQPNSLTAMSRIYKLETVGSRSGLCLRDRTVDIPSVHLVKVKPLMSNAQQGDSKAFSGEDICGVQSIQRQIEQFQLKEKEALKSCTSPNSPRKDRETKGQQSPFGGLLKQQVKDDAKSQEKDQETLNPKVTPQPVCSPTSQLKQSNQTITVAPPLVRSQSPDNTPKSSDYAPTPASSPSIPSPAPSPSISPSSTPSPTLFSIRSASGGKVKRGTTITISPRKPAVGGGAGGATGPTAGSTAAGPTPAKTPSQPAQTAPTVAEPAKKKYPTAEEIEVIGGYQNLEKSCLIKNRGTPKRVKVCFDEDQLEQVCEYPSETSMLSYTPFPHDVWRLQGEEAQEEEAEVEGGSIVSKAARNVRIATARGLRVDESCPR